MPKPIFPEGIRYFEPNERTPEFIKGTILINRDEMLKWLETQDEEITIDRKIGAETGKHYLAVNTYKKEAF